MPRIFVDVQKPNDIKDTDFAVWQYIVLAAPDYVVPFKPDPNMSRSQIWREKRRREQYDNRGHKVVGYAYTMPTKIVIANSRKRPIKTLRYFSGSYPQHDKVIALLESMFEDPSLLNDL